MNNSLRTRPWAALVAVAVSACADGGVWDHVLDRPGKGGGVAEPSCDDIRAEFAVERAAVQACESDDECGQVLSGTSCGCTRELVGRLDADTDRFFELVRAQVEGENCAGLISTCDCPEARGFVCENGVCGWNFVEPGFCGNAGLTCDAGTEFCVETIGGVPGPDGKAIFSYSCADAGPCAGDLASCECLFSELLGPGLAVSCDDTGALPQVTIAAP